MSLQGRLEDLPLADILKVLAAARRSGLLRLAATAGSAEILFRDGAIVGLRGAGMPTSLVELLQDCRALDGAELREAERSAADSGRPLDDVLAEGRIVPALAIEQALEAEIERRLPLLAALDAGTFEFALLGGAADPAAGFGALALPHGLPVPQLAATRVAAESRPPGGAAVHARGRLLLAEESISLPGTPLPPPATHATPGAPAPAPTGPTPREPRGVRPREHAPEPSATRRPASNGPRACTVLHCLPPGPVLQGLLGALAERGIGARAVASASDVKAGIDAARARGESVAVACHADHPGLPGLEVVARATSVDTGVAVALLVAGGGPVGRLAAIVDRARRLGVRAIALLPDEAGHLEAGADVAARLLSLLSSEEPLGPVLGPSTGPEGEILPAETPPARVTRTGAQVSALARWLASAGEAVEIARDLAGVAAEHFDRAAVLLRVGARLQTLGATTEEAGRPAQAGLALDDAGIVAQAVTEATPLDTAPRPEDAAVLSALGAEGATRLVAMPLLAAGTCFGVVVATSGPAGTEADLELVSRFIHDVAPTLWDALSREQAREEARRLRATA